MASAPHFFLFHRHLHATCRQPLLFFMEYHYEDFVGLIQKSIVEHWDLNALTDYKGVTLQYKDVARKIEKLHILFETA